MIIIEYGYIAKDGSINEYEKICWDRLKALRFMKSLQRNARYYVISYKCIKPSDFCWLRQRM